MARSIFRVAALAGLLAGAALPVAASPADALRAGDMQAMIPEIIGVYEDAGLSWDHSIDWRVGPFTTTFWYYSLNEGAIITGAVPTSAEVDAYWQTWSAVLTDGHFDPAGFFASATEAEELARYNQYVLATHESAHAMTYRYDYDHLERHDYAINCREYYADRLTVAILNEQARLDPDMARWRQRYLDLVTAMGDTIPEQYRYRIADFATLDADCAVIDVAQPTPETMQPYASAYFERYRVLLEADLPSMADMLATHLQSYQDERLASLAFDSDRARYELATRADVVPRSTVGAGRDERFNHSRAAAFAPDGTLYFATLGYDADTREAELQFGADPATHPLLTPASPWPRPSERLEISSLAVLSPDYFLFALEHWEYVAGSDVDYVSLVSWARAQRKDGAWTVETLGDVEDMRSAAVLRGPGDRVYLLSTMDQASSFSRSNNWRMIEIDPATLEVIREVEVRAGIGIPAAIDAEDRLLEAVLDEIWRARAVGGRALLVGTGLQGLRDGPLATAELVSPDAMQWMADGTALILDVSLGYEDWVIRELRPVPAAP